MFLVAILPWLVLHEDCSTSAVPAHIYTEVVSDLRLDPSRHQRRLLCMDSVQLHLQLLSYRLVLEHRHQGQVLLACRGLVHERSKFHMSTRRWRTVSDNIAGHQHRNRLGDCHSAYARLEKSSAPEETAHRSDGCLCSWRIVSRRSSPIIEFRLTYASVCVISIIRIPTLAQISRSPDVTYSNQPAALWSALEVNIGIICASLPSLKAAATRFFPRIFLSKSLNLSSHTHGTGRRTSEGVLSDRPARVLDPYHVDEEIGKAFADVYAQRSYLPAQKSSYRSHIGSGRELSNGGRTRTNSNEHFDTEMMALSRDAQNMPEGRINVVTVVEQEIERSKGSCTKIPGRRPSSPKEDDESDQDIFHGYHERFRGQDFEVRR